MMSGLMAEMRDAAGHSGDKQHQQGGGDHSPVAKATPPEPEVRQLLGFFQEAATIHGVHQASGPLLYSHRRLIWWCLIVFMALSLTILLYFDFDRYSRHPSLTSVESHYSELLPFPAVTICNLNLFHRNRVPEEDEELVELLYNMSELSSIKSSLEQPRFSVGGSIGLVEPIRQGPQLQQFASRAGHQMEDMFRMCQWAGQRRPCADLLQRLPTDYGFCYTFNGLHNVTRNVSSTGPLSGLRLLIDIEQDFYYYSWTTQAGLKVALHDADEEPVMANRGIFVQPGSSTSVAVTVAEFQGLPAPYKAFGGDECLDTDDPNFQSPLETKDFGYKYTSSLCQRECLVKFLFHHCGCYHFLDGDRSPLCDLDTLKKCYLPRLQSVNLTDLRRCECPHACKQRSYLPNLSFASFVSTFVERQLRDEGIIQNTSFLRENMIDLRIFYDSLMVTYTIQKPEMTVNSILGSLGGHMGLFLGASLLSLTELIEFVLLLVIRAIHRRRKSDVDTDVICVSQSRSLSK